MSQFCTFQDQVISSGDTVRITQEITEGDKKRLQMFEGIVIAIRNRGAGKSFIVRKIATNGIGVEKIFPLALPSLKKIEIKRSGMVRRNKLYYLRERIGKAATRIKEEKSFFKAAPAA